MQCLQSYQHHGGYDHGDGCYADGTAPCSCCAVLCSATLHNGIAGLLTLFAYGVVGSVLARLATRVAIVVGAHVQTLVLILHALPGLDARVPACRVPALAIGEHHGPLVLLQPADALGARAGDAHVFGLAKVGQRCAGIIAAGDLAELHLRGAKGGLVLQRRGVVGEVPVVNGEARGVGKHDLVWVGLERGEGNKGSSGGGVGKGVVGRRRGCEGRNGGREDGDVDHGGGRGKRRGHVRHSTGSVGGRGDGVGSHGARCRGIGTRGGSDG